MSNQPARPTPHGVELQVNPAWEIHPAQLNECLQKKEDLLLLDVRRPVEFAKARLPNATLIPMQELEARQSELAPFKSKPVVVFCHHGGRSLRVTAFLRHLGFQNVHSLAGGIDAWSLIIDPSVPRY